MPSFFSDKNILRVLIGFIIIIGFVLFGFFYLTKTIISLIVNEKPTTIISISSINIEKQEVTLSSNKKENLNNYILRQEDDEILYSLTGKEIEAGIPLVIKVPQNFLNEKNNLISLHHIKLLSEKEDKNPQKSLFYRIFYNIFFPRYCPFY